MARNGEPGRALWLGVWASFFGGLLGGLFLIMVTGPLAAIALEFGPWEFFSLFVLAMAMVAGLTEASFVKGLLATAIGLLITVIGSDPIGNVQRFTFGSEFLVSGFPFLPVLIGVFAFAQIMTDIEKLRDPRSAAAGGGMAVRPTLSVSHPKVIWEILSRPFLLLWSTLVGIVIGVLPAIGGSAANMMAYDQAKKFSRRPETFGSGIPEGIIASESANNANVGGSLVTIMAFGIPGDAVTAVMLGAMTIHGIQSGPLFVSQNPDVAFGIYAAYILAHPLMLLIIGFSTFFILRITTVRLAVLAPVVLVLCVIGAYALNNTMQSVYVLLIFGVIGYALVKAGLPLAPLILGLILGDQIELNLIRAIMTDSDPWLFVTRPISGGLLATAALSVGVAVWQHLRHQRRVSEADTDF
jgi:putative tricarboxylic transport membrane protein